MQTKEIPREAWPSWLASFTNLHEGWLISLEVLAPEIGSQMEIDNLPLLGISPDRIGPDSAVAISVARSAADHFTHLIRAVTRIYVVRTDEGADAALQIESADGAKAVLRFRGAVLPETVDGVPG